MYSPYKKGVRIYDLYLRKGARLRWRGYGVSGGFTLVEMLLIVFMLGVIVSLALPYISSMVDQTRLVRCASRLEMIERAKTAYVVDNLAGQASFDHVNLQDLPVQEVVKGVTTPLRDERKAVFQMYFMEPFPFTCPAAPEDSPVAYSDAYHLYRRVSCPHCGGGGGSP